MILINFAILRLIINNNKTVIAVMKLSFSSNFQMSKLVEINCYHKL